MTILLGDEIILLLTGFGNEINLSLLIIDNFWDKLWLFSMTKLLSFNDEIFHWEKPLGTQILFC